MTSIDQGKSRNSTCLEGHGVFVTFADLRSFSRLNRHQGRH